MRTVCEAVQHAHQRGVIHRDLKPSNILVTADGQPHVLDFGLAKTLLEDEAQLAVSMDGEVAGTPAYMSPEQAAAKLNQIDTRTDVYSLGVILYQLLTGEFPHDLSGTRLEVLRRIAEDEVRRPRQFSKAVDKELEALLLKALAHDPEGRYPTAHALAEDLRRYAAYEPIEARPMGSFGRMRRWCKRKPVVAGLVAAVAVALVAGTGISTYFGVVAQRRAAEAQAEGRKRETVQRLEAERQTRLANAQRLAAQSGNALDGHPQRSLHLAMEALETTLRHGEPRVPEAEQALRDALARVGGRSLRGHEAPIWCVAISPDGRWLVTGSHDATARLWDLTAKDPAAAPIVLRGHEAPIWCVAISPDSRWLVTGSWDKTARLWDLMAKDPAAAPIVLRGHEGGIHCVAISPDGRWLVTGSEDKTARLWDLTAKDPAAAPTILRGHEGGIRCMAISPDGRWLVTGSEQWLVTGGGYDRTARLWDLTAKDSSAVPAGTVLPVSGVKAVAFSPDNRWLVTGSDDKTARLWDLTAKDPAAAPTILRGHESGIVCVAISPDGRWLVTGSGDKTARVWDLAAKDPAAAPIVLRGHEQPIGCVAISPDGRWLVTGSCPGLVTGSYELKFAYDRTARLWDLTAKDPAAAPIVLRGHEDLISCVAISPDGRWLVTGSNDGTARLWDLTAPAAVPIVLRGHEQPIGCVAISPDGRWLVTGSGNAPTARLWNLTAKNPAAAPIVLRGHHW